MDVARCSAAPRSSFWRRLLLLAYLQTSVSNLRGRYVNEQFDEISELGPHVCLHGVLKKILRFVLVLQYV
jgi:hypothetical protein